MKTLRSSPRSSVLSASELVVAVSGDGFDDVLRRKKRMTKKEKSDQKKKRKKMRC
jgi:hypothetical protein